MMGGPPPGAPMPPEGAAPPPGPAAAPMAQETENAGAMQAGAAEVESAQSMLAQALTKMKPGSPEYKALAECTAKLAKVFGNAQAAPLVPAQIMQLAQAQQSSPLMQVLARGQGNQAPPGAT